MKQICLEENRLQEILLKIRKVRLCVVGDVCMDIYWYADMKKSRLSRETPHYPLPIVREISSPGACGNVINNMSALPVGKITPVSVFGKDWRGYLLLKWFREHGISMEGLIESSRFVTPAYGKPMRMGISDVVYEDPRLDFENREPVSGEDEEKVLNALTKAASESDVIVVSDQFSFGIITEKVRKKLAELAEKMPVIVDSREKAPLYRGMILKPNEIEAAQCLGKEALPESASDADYEKLADELAKRNGQPVIITLGKRGAVWSDGRESVLAPAFRNRHPIDIVGAGDTFLSAFSAAYAAGISGKECTFFASLASAVTVRKIGTTGTATAEEILDCYRESCL